MTVLVQRVAWNVAQVMVGRAASVAINAATLMFIARSLGPTGFGLYALVLVYVSFFSSIIDQGINITITRALTRTPDAVPRLIGNALLLKSATGAVLMGLAIAIAQLPYFEASVRTVTPIASGLILVTSLSVINALFQVRLRVSWVVAGDLVTRVTFFALALTILRAGGGVGPLLLGQVAAATIGLLVTLIAALWLVAPDFTPDFAIWRRVMRDAVVISMSLGLGAVAARFDVMALSAHAAPNEVGLYSAAFRVVDVVLLVPALLMQVVFPVLVDRSDDDVARLEIGYRRVADLLALTGLPLAIFLTVFPRDVLAVVGGAAYRDGGPYLAVLSWGMLAVFLSNGMLFVLLAKARQRAILLWPAIGVGVSVVGSLQLMNRFGGTGVAVATVLAHTIMLVGFSAELWYDIGVRPWPRIGPELCIVGVVVTAAAIIARAAGASLWVAAPLVALGFTVALLVSQRTRSEIGDILARWRQPGHELTIR